MQDDDKFEHVEDRQLLSKRRIRTWECQWLYLGDVQFHRKYKKYQRLFESLQSKWKTPLKYDVIFQSH